MKIFYWIIGLVLLTSCGSTKKIEALKPEPSTNTPMVYESNTSYLPVPISITLSDIEKLTNTNLNGLIYNDSILTDDQTQMKIWKTAPIKITEKNGKIKTVLPLKIWINYQYGSTLLQLTDTKQLNLKGTLTLESVVQLKNWQLTSTSELIDYQWDESPSITIAGKSVPVTYLVNPALSLSKKKISKKIDDALAKSCDFKPQISSILETLSNPILTNETYEAWFKLIPLELYTTDAQIQKNKVLINLGLKCTMQTMVGAKPKNTFKASQLVLKPISQIPNELQATIAAVSTYQNASRLLTKNFQNIPFEANGRKIQVTNVQLWYKDTKVIIALDVTGSVTGTLYLSGQPNYNPSKKEIYFENVNYVLNTKNVLLKSANWLAGGTILKKIQDNCKYSITENLEEAKKGILPYLQNYSPTQGVYVNGTIKQFDFEKVSCNNSGIVAFLKATGTLQINLNGM